MKTLKKKTLKAAVPMFGVGPMKVLIISLFFVSLFFLNSYGDSGKDLIEAAAQGDTARVNALLNKGVDVNAKDEKGWTALMRASENGNTKIVQLLKKAGAKE